MPGNCDTAGVIAPPPLIFLGFLALGLGSHFAVGNDAIPLAFAVRHLIGLVLFGGGIALLVAAVGGFRRAGTPPQPWEPTKAIVDTGIYGRTRNPMYLGMALIYLGIAFELNSLAALALLVPTILVVQQGVIVLEERYLKGKFGAAYDDYRRKVRR